MGETLVHRGPDDSGVWADEAAGIALTHRRLSVVDLSAQGHQPMVSSDGRYVIAYNGEVYNAAELGAELEARGRGFRGHCDTEVILEACAAWGVEEAVRRFIGMFAFALWDRDARTLTLVRDRLGIKPLYWGRFDRVFLFASELKALRADPGWTVEIDRDALIGFVRHGYLPAPHSIYRGIRKLEPGCMVVVGPNGEPESKRYWDLHEVARRGAERRLGADDGEAVERLDALLRDAVKRRMVADVPLGVFLSGGIDSSTVAALMQAESDRPVRSFSIGFRERGYNEAHHASAVAAHLGTDHTELYVEPDHALAVIPRLPDLYDEPFADSSQIPTFLLSEMTRNHVTVALSGDGGDELFGGYNRYLLARALWGRIGWLPHRARATAARAIRAVSPLAWDRMFTLVPSRMRPPQAGDKAHKLAGLLALRDPGAFYRHLVSQWQAPETLVRGGSEARAAVWSEALDGETADLLQRMRFLDTVTYLPDDILTKVDRASMAVSLEARVPLLDHRVVELAWRLRSRHLVRGSESKWALRQVLYRYVPKALIDRPKMGFGVPIGTWLRGPLRDWAEELLAARALEGDGLLDPGPIRRLWEEHLTGTRNWQYPLWVILMFQQWKVRWLG